MFYRLLWLMDEKGQQRTEEDMLLQRIFIMVHIIVIGVRGVSFTHLHECGS